MKDLVKVFKILSDESRLRMLMLLTVEELCVCQIMGVLGISQPLVSRNISILCNAGLLDGRREGKLIFYSIKKKLPNTKEKLIKLLKEELKDDPIFKKDKESLVECHEYQKKTGKCDMETFLEYIKRKKNIKGEKNA